MRLAATWRERNTLRKRERRKDNERKILLRKNERESERVRKGVVKKERKRHKKKDDRKLNERNIIGE